MRGATVMLADLEGNILTISSETFILPKLFFDYYDY